MNTYVAYYRVSTDRQGRSGLGLEAQREAVLRHVGDGLLAAEFTEVESGRKSDRPQLAAALAAARDGKAILVIAKLDRLARNVHFISGLLEAGVPFVCADMPEADRTWLQMSAVFAEWEARKIGERTKAALAAAKARGTRLGNPNPAAAARLGAAAMAARADEYASRVLPILREAMAQQEHSLRELAAMLQARGIRTPTGRDRWHPSQVANLLERA